MDAVGLGNVLLLLFSPKHSAVAAPRAPHTSRPPSDQLGAFEAGARLQGNGFWKEQTVVQFFW